MPFQLNPAVRLFFVVLLVCTVIFIGFSQEKKADSLQKLLTGHTDTTEVRILNQLSEAVRKIKADDAIAYGVQALEKSNALSFKPGLLKALHNIGLGYGYSNDMPRAIDYLTQAAVLAEKQKEFKVAANCYTNIGSLYAVLGNNDKWIESYLKALKLSEKAGDRKATASILYGIGNSFASEKKFNQALENYNKSIELFQELNEHGELPKVYANMGRMYEDSANYSQALLYYDKALTGFKEFNNDRGRASALAFRANTYFLEKRFDEALIDLNESVALSEKSNYQVAIADALILKSKVYQAQKKSDPAIEMAQQAITLARKIGSKTNLSAAYELLSGIYFARGDFKSAYSYQGLHAAYADSTFNAQKSRQIQEMQFRFETEKKESEIEMLRYDQYLNRIYVFVALTAVVMFMIIGFLVINHQKLKIRKDRELTSKENQIMEEKRSLIEAELLNRRLNEERLQSMIEFKNKEMTTYALNLIQKNELLDNIKEGIEEIRSVETDQIKPKLQTLLNAVNYSFHLDKDWENFRMHFEQVHESFFVSLHEMYPDLGPNDIKLCALIRLNLDTKAMATVLDISPESAKVARHRLRKKLNLPPEQNLTSFLVNL